MVRLLLSLMILWSAQSLAVIETYEFSSPELELRYKALVRSSVALSAKIRISLTQMHRSPGTCARLCTSS